MAVEPRFWHHRVQLAQAHRVIYFLFGSGQLRVLTSGQGQVSTPRSRSWSKEVMSHIIRFGRSSWVHWWLSRLASSIWSGVIEEKLWPLWRHKWRHARATMQIWSIEPCKECMKSWFYMLEIVSDHSRRQNSNFHISPLTYKGLTY